MGSALRLRLERVLHEALPSCLVDTFAYKYLLGQL